MTLRDAGHDVTIVRTTEKGFNINHWDLSRYSHIIAQRQVMPGILDHLLRVRDETGCVLLYEVDDNLHRVHPESHAYKVFKPGGEVLRHVDRWLRSVDGIIVTTPDLAGQYADYNNRIYVVNNFLDLHIRDWSTPVPRDERLQGKTVIGWAGGSTHQEDDEPLRGVLSQILADYPDVIFALCSHPQLMKQFMVRQQVPPDRVVMLDPVDFQDYPKIPTQFDIGIAPLRDTPFNRNKSALKLMEYGACEVPYVASDIAPYRRFHKETNGVGGFLAEGKADWDVALRTLIEQPAVRQRHATDIRELIWSRYGLVSNIGKWEEVLEKSLDRNLISTWEKTEKPGRNSPCPCGSGLKLKRCCRGAFG
jgi:O-antigen biosynthesis protein